MRTNEPTKSDLTVTNLIEIVRQDTSLRANTRQATLTGLRQFCRILGESPADVPASTDGVRERINSIYPETTGYSRRTIVNAKASFLRALHMAGISRLPRTSETKLDPHWRALIDPLDIQSRRILSRFARSCSAFFIEPPKITQAMLDEFAVMLREGTLIKDPHHSVVKVCWCWNRLRRTRREWPDVDLIPPSKRRSAPDLAWKELPSTLRADIASFLAQLESGRPVLRGSRPRKRVPQTIELYRSHLRKVASLALQAGIPTGRLTDLRCLIAPETVKAAFNHYHSVEGDPARPYMARLMLNLRFVAKHWVQADENVLRELDVIHTRIGKAKPKLTDRSREQLRLLNDPNQLRALIFLPETLMERARTGAGPRRPWNSAQSATAIAMLWSAPSLSARKLRSIDRFEHLLKAEDGTYTLSVPDRADARGRPLRYRLSNGASEILDEYLERFFPAGAACPWLFPNRYGGQKSRNMMSKQIKREIGMLTGLEMHALDFRHLAAKLYLDRNPGEFEVVRRLLGQKSISSTLTYYRELSEALGPTTLDSIVLEGRP